LLRRRGGWFANPKGSFERSEESVEPDWGRERAQGKDDFHVVPDQT